jgi:hypothetical protein
VPALLVTTAVTVSFRPEHANVILSEVEGSRVRSGEISDAARNDTWKESGMQSVVEGLRVALSTPSRFSQMFFPDHQMRRYQAEVADAIGMAVDTRSFTSLRMTPSDGKRGIASEFAAVFSRQAGKDEMLAQLCAWLLVRNSRIGGQIIIALPSLDPQGLIARDRLVSRLQGPRLQQVGVSKSSGRSDRRGRTCYGALCQRQSDGKRTRLDCVASAGCQ